MWGVIWPGEHSLLTIIRTALRFQLFVDPSITKKFQLELLTNFCNACFLSNAHKATNSLAPLDMEGCEKLALHQLQGAGRPPVVPAVRDHMVATGKIDSGTSYEAQTKHDIAVAALISGNIQPTRGGGGGGGGGGVQPRGGRTDRGGRRGRGARGDRGGRGRGDKSTTDTPATSHTIAPTVAICNDFDK